MMYWLALNASSALGRVIGLYLPGYKDWGHAFTRSDVFGLSFFPGTERDEIMQNLCVDKVPSPDPNQNQLSSGPLQVQSSEKI